MTGPGSGWAQTAIGSIAAAGDAFAESPRGELSPVIFLLGSGLVASALAVTEQLARIASALEGLEARP